MADTFEQQLAKFREKVEKKSSQVCVKVGLDLHKMIVKRTPVDTGRLKANNQITAGSKASSATTDTDKTGASTIGNGVSAMNSFKLGQDIWICNNVEYAYPIEFEGHSSKKAPEGFFRVSVGDVVAQWPNIVSEVKSAP